MEARQGREGESIPVPLPIKSAARGLQNFLSRAATPPPSTPRAVGCEEGTRGDDAAEELTIGRLENKHVTGELKAAYDMEENRSHADG